MANRKSAEEGKLQWAQVLNGRPPPTPLCDCGQPTVLRSVLKANENWGRKARREILMQGATISSGPITKAPRDRRLNNTASCAKG
ncbi:hypothetical protein JG687_00006683 [Phytophthora cactorum]|uniref:Uncharacterized protein n=1 Tax=Phytophthora cactorum TaxID=29920 RepID=A0A8T1ULV7_9STRA|nr:hypothetical protein JG687_00006683 [Phytophthora cactorum]